MLLHLLILSEKEDEQLKQQAMNGSVSLFEEYKQKQNMEGRIMGGKDVIGVQLILLTTQLEVVCRVCHCRLGG